VRRATLLILGATLLAACGGGGGDRTVRHPPDGTRIDVAGSPYAVTVPAGLTSVDVTPYDPGPAGGSGAFAIRIGPDRSTTGSTATLMAIPAGEQLADAPLALARRFSLATAQTSDPNGDAHGPLQERRLGGRAGFRIPAKGSQTMEYRGAAVGTWLVLEICSAADAAHDPGATCDALDATLELRDAPPPAAAGGKQVVARGDLLQFVIPTGFAPASPSRQARLRHDLAAQQATLIRSSWENTIVVIARPSDASYRPPADSSAFCATLASQFPTATHILEPMDGTLGGRRAVGCTIAPRPGREALLMPDQRGRLYLAVAGGTMVGVTCSSTAGQREATDRACDQVLDTIDLGLRRA
jgi:hypothetical protein